MLKLSAREFLAQSKKEFSEWRSQAKSGDRIPEELWRKAVELTQHYSRSFVASELRLDHNTLRQQLGIEKRGYRKSKAVPRFSLVTPDFSKSPSSSVLGARGEVLFEVESNGMTLRFFR